MMSRGCLLKKHPFFVFRLLRTLYSENGMIMLCLASELSYSLNKQNDRTGEKFIFYMKSRF